jgi:nitrous oxide reductase
MVLLADHPVRPEPHDFIIFKRELLHPSRSTRWTISRWPSRIRRSPACSAMARRSR